MVVLWLSPVLFVPDVEPFFSPAMPQDVRGQLNHLYYIMENPARRRAALEELRRQNPEWDCIAQTFFAYALANVALKYPAERKRALACMDVLIEETVKVPWREFLLSYGRDREFVHKPESSLMVDGELSLLIGLRRLVRDEPGYRHRDEHERLVQLCVEAMEASPVLCAESYPDECWLFCNGLALASIKVFDVVEGTDHSDLFHR